MRSAGGGDEIVRLTADAVRPRERSIAGSASEAGAVAVEVASVRAIDDPGTRETPVIIGQTNGSKPPPKLVAGSSESVRVLIADQDGLARSFVRTALGDLDRVAIVLTARDSREALELARYYRPTVAIIDTALPPSGGLALLAKVLAVSPGTRVLTMSVDDYKTAIAALRAGAIGHIGKDVEPEDLAGLVLRAADGEAIVPQWLISPLVELVREVPDAGWRPLHSRLTTREWEIIELLGEESTTQEIAEQLVLSSTTVYSHIKSIMRKLDVHTRSDAVVAARCLRREEALAAKARNVVQATLSS
ncbi:MAG: response regulator transcription factor [Solirubrobacterales bacterium]|nr:response regulator transcription factor [Solirubrobacterales bacterium]